ncbi:MAG: anaerobic ribonucleoside-triphosphate reductase activating protein [Alphaproteobacteria bacterium]|nr:anaerobic ribonucleoside-triphosphate reductase activating protein [Alphaproteobacteria bacterium]
MSNNATALQSYPPNIREAPNTRKTKEAVLPIYDLTPFTMLDFPDKCAAIIWFSGCNMRCPYCHNPEIVKGKGNTKIDDVLNFLEKRKSLLDGVVLSGGEASIYPGLPDFVRKVKEMGYAIKLDTNGTRPDLVKNFLEHGYLDYIALDYKAPPEKFKRITGFQKFETFLETLSILCKQNTVQFEIRTTVHTSLLNEQDITAIINDLSSKNYIGTYYVQNFQNNNDSPTLEILPPQERILDISQLPQPKGFSIEFRNF